MKKLFLSACLMAVLHPAFAQFYIRANVGYNFPLSPELIGTDETTYNEPEVEYRETVKGVYGSFGSGFSAGIAFGGSFKESQLGYDLAFSYVFGKKYTVSDVYSTPDASAKEAIVTNASSFQINPSLSFTVGGDKFQPVARFGPVIGFTKLNQEQTASYNNNQAKLEIEYTGGLSIGLRGAIGVNYNLSERLKLFTEINFLSMSTAPKTRTITAYKINGEDKLEDIPKEDIEVDLEESYTIDDNDEEEGEPALRERYTMSSWGLQVGILFSFGQ